MIALCYSFNGFITICLQIAAISKGTLLSKLSQNAQL